jgi:hypothetical protein
MSAGEDQLYGLMEIAERQQAAVQAALEGLAAERAALARERETFAQEVALLRAGTREAVSLAVAEGFAGAAGKGVEAVQVATQPLLGKLEGVTASAARAEAALRRVVSWASWRLLGWIMILIVALVWWDTGTITQLQSEISELQASHESWVKAGMLDRLERCAPGNRPCVEVNEDAGPFGTPGGSQDYRVLKGY